MDRYEYVMFGKVRDTVLRAQNKCITLLRL